MGLHVHTENRITTVRLDRPQARNAVTPDLATRLFEAFLAFDADQSADIAILTGDETAFCAGFDLKAAATGLTQTWLDRHAIPDDWVDPAKNPLPSPMGPARLMLSKPVIAAIEGPAVAGGMELALWADIRIVAKSAYFGVFCRRWGVPLIDGGTVRLAPIVGQGRAHDLILSGRVVEVAEALNIGLATRVCPDGEALAIAVDYARDLQRYPRDCMLADWRATRTEPASLAAGLRREWQSAGLVARESAKGAARFAAGKGRGGDFGEI